MGGRLDEAMQCGAPARALPRAHAVRWRTCKRQKKNARLHGQRPLERGSSPPPPQTLLYLVFQGGRDIFLTTFRLLRVPCVHAAKSLDIQQ